MGHPPMVPDAKEAFLYQWSYKNKIILDSSSICVTCHSLKQSLWPQESPQTDQAGSGAHPSDWRGSLPHQTSENALLYRAENTNQGRKEAALQKGTPWVSSTCCYFALFTSYFSLKCI